MLEGIGRSNDMKIVNPRMETTIQQMDSPTTARDQQTEPRLSPTPVLSEKTPEEFYAEITKRADVRAIMEELATG
jgi:hypothetical protein